MAVSTRLIKRRIKSVSSTKKITGAMELVAASKMRKAISAVTASRPYSRLGKEMIDALGGIGEGAEHPLLRENKDAEKVLLITISSDRGLAGGYNAQIIRKIFEFGKEQKAAGKELEYVTLGKKAQDAIRRAGGTVVAAFLDLGNNPTIIATRPVSELAMREYIAGKYSNVYLVYTDFVSSLKQKAIVSELLPLRKEDLAADGEPGKEFVSKDFIFEPDPLAVFSAMLPRLLETQVYQAVLESTASEHSARMLAMRNATDAARDMIDDLTFTFNQARQAGITREISEIAAGKAALE